MMASTRRTLFIVGSITAHAALAVGIFASQVWGIERLDGSIKPSTGFAVMLPPMPAPSGGSPTLPEVKVEKKKRTVTETVQPTVKLDQPVAPSEQPSITAGSGDGSGSGSGSSTDIGTCVVDCGPGSGSGSAAPPVVKKDPPPPTEELVPPNVLTMMRTSGSPQIHPTEVTKTEMLRDGRSRTTGVAKVCVSDSGAVVHASMLQSTKYPAYDARLLEGIRSWTYKPYVSKGRNVKVCGTVTFVYGMK